MISTYYLPAVPYPIQRINIDGRIVEFCAPNEVTDRVLVAHDGQSVFNPDAAKNGQTWKLAETAATISTELGTNFPLIVAIWHQGQVGDSVSRGLDLSPEAYFKSGMELFPKNGPFDVSAIKGDEYLNNIFNKYLPAVVSLSNVVQSPEKTAMIGASRGALCSLYALRNHGDQFKTAIAHSTHWPIGKDPLVRMTIGGIPAPGEHRIWMSHGSEGFDAEYQPFQKLANRLMIKKGYRENMDFHFNYYPGGDHKESDWAKQAADSLQFWLKK